MKAVTTQIPNIWGENPPPPKKKKKKKELKYDVLGQVQAQNDSVTYLRFGEREQQQHIGCNLWVCI